MTAVLLRARSELRSRWRAWVSLTVMLGLFGGAVIAIAAGARRTDSAYSRFLAWSRAWDVNVPNFTFSGNRPRPVDLSKVDALPRVSDAVHVDFFDVRTPYPDLGGGMASPSARFGRTFERVKLLAGRLPRTDREDEALVAWTTAGHDGLHVGSTFPITSRSGGHVVARVSVRVVGIGAFAGAFPPQLGGSPGFVLSSAFDRRFADRLEHFSMSAIRLRHGAPDIPGFVADVHDLTQHRLLYLLRWDDQARNVERSLHLQAIALWLLAGLVAVVAMLTFGQTQARQILLHGDENPELRSLGMTRPQLLAVAAIRGAVLAGAGAALAVIVAVLASSLFPTGVARVADPDPGLRLDGAALGLGAIGIVIAVAVLGALPAWRASARRTSDEVPDRASSLVHAGGRAGLPVSAVAGIRMALGRRSERTSVPVRSSVAGVTLALAALCAALTFGASLTRLLGTPHLYGQDWNLTITTGTSGFISERQSSALQAAVQGDARITAVGVGTAPVTLSVDGTTTDGFSVYGRPGAVRPVELSGRLPSSPRELSVGPKLLRETGTRIGDTVRVSVYGSAPKPMRIVGTAVIPPQGDSSSLGAGAFFDYSAATYLVQGNPPPDSLLIRTKPGVDPSSVGADIVRRLRGVVDAQAGLPSKPNDLVNFGRVQDLPLLLAALVALMAAATLAHLLVTGIRRRRHDLALLKTLGFVRSQLSATVAWQASILALAALVVGVPVGVAAGRWVWTAFADDLGVLASPAVPLASVLAVIPATLLVANLIAFLPGRSAARVQAAAILRTE